MDDAIYKLLETISNVYSGWYRKDISETHVTFLKYHYSPDTFLDDEATEEYMAFQFDFWGTNKDEVEKTEKKVRKILKANNFEWLEGNVDFETDTEIYHYSDRFSTNIEVGDEV